MCEAPQATLHLAIERSSLGSTGLGIFLTKCQPFVFNALHRAFVPALFRVWANATLRFKVLAFLFSFIMERLADSSFGAFLAKTLACFSM